MTSTEITEPDVDTDPETMSLEAVQAELREPSSASVESEEHRARRQALWQRLDALTRLGGAGQLERQVR